MKRNAVAIFFVLNHLLNTQRYKAFVESKHGWNLLIKLQLIEFPEIAKVAREIALKVNNTTYNSICVPIINKEGQTLYKDIIVSFEYHTNVEILDIASKL